MPIFKKSASLPNMQQSSVEFRSVTIRGCVRKQEKRETNKEHGQNIMTFHAYALVCIFTVKQQFKGKHHEQICSSLALASSASGPEIDKFVFVVFIAICFARSCDGRSS